MHELQLMRQVVDRAEAICQNHPGTSLSLIRLTISSHSRLASHTPEELQGTFRLATEGTPAYHATLDIQILPAKGTCQSCGQTTERGPEMLDCSHCSSSNVLWEDQPELVLKEIELLEESE